MANGSAFIIRTKEEINALTFLRDKGTDLSMLNDYPIIVLFVIKFSQTFAKTFEIT